MRMLLASSGCTAAMGRHILGLEGDGDLCAHPPPAWPAAGPRTSWLVLDGESSIHLEQRLASGGVYQEISAGLSSLTWVGKPAPPEPTTPASAASRIGARFAGPPGRHQGMLPFGFLPPGRRLGRRPLAPAAGRVEAAVRSFMQEAMMLSKLDHPNIVKVHHVFEDNETAYTAMDDIDGPDLLQTVEAAPVR